MFTFKYKLNLLKEYSFLAIYKYRIITLTYFYIKLADVSPKTLLQLITYSVRSSLVITKNLVTV